MQSEPIAAGNWGPAPDPADRPYVAYPIVGKPLPAGDHRDVVYRGPGTSARRSARKAERQARKRGRR
jgi:hypothetical protein